MGEGKSNISCFVGNVYRTDFSSKVGVWVSIMSCFLAIEKCFMMAMPVLD